jgi:polyisoprenoid-binding protein YceI
MKLRQGIRRPTMTTHAKPLPISHDIAMKGAMLTTGRRGAAAFVLAILCSQGALSQAAGPSAPPAPPPMAPAGQYQIDKSHASLVLRVNHLGFSTYTTRFSRFDAALTFDPSNIPASKVVTTIDASSFEMDAAPQMCLDIVKGPQLLDTGKFPEMVFKSERVRMTGAKSMEISGTLTLHGVTRPLVLTATFNGGYPGLPKMDPHARIGFSAHGSFKRSEFGMTFGIPAPGTTMGVSDLIDFSIEAEFTGPALAGAAAETH